MAGAKPGVHALQLKPMVVHEDLKRGGKFIKWEEDVNITPCLVTLKVDPEGFFVHWNSLPTQEVEVMDISMIRDTRLGKYAKQPKDPKVQKLLDYTEEKELCLLTIVYGTDLVNISFLNILALQEETAKLWADELFSLATNLLSHNASRTTYLLKVYTKLKIQVMKDGKIPVKNFHKMFSDKKRVETALEQCNLVKNKSDGIRPEDFTWEAFQKFLNGLCLRSELQTIFEDCGSKKKLFISLDQFMNFLNQKQRDPRLNEVLFPPLKREQVRQVMEKYEVNISQLDRDQISFQAFSQYLAGEENGIVPPERFDVIEEDMKQPLSHYFINSSHNTYLTVGQLTGLSSVEMYRQVLLTGCRCIELDCWKGRPPDEEPNITHGFTMTTEISFKEVIEAIAESAFKTSSYPVILSFENHVDSPKQQAKMAEYCRNIFKEALLVDPLEKYPLIPGQPLPSPMDLLGKILIKNKKRHHHDLHESVGSVRRRGTEEQLSPLKDGPVKKSEGSQLLSNGEENDAEQMIRESGPRKSLGGEGESEEEEEDELALNSKKPTTDEGTASSEAKATEEMSTLVNYIEPVKFKSFELATKRNLFFEMSSFVETKGMDILKNSPIEFVDYNKNQLSRIYPKGTRVDSSNYNPQLFWNAGCQMVALNFQTLDLPMQLNMGAFEYNGSSGYLLKPEVMRRMDKQFDPFTENTVDGIVANTLSIKVISGQFLSDKKVGVYVEVDIFGLPADTKRKYRTKTSYGNSLDPVWDDEAFIFAKVILPTLASLRIAVFEESGKFVGHRILPVSAIRPGYRYINLKNDLNQPLMLPSLLVYTEVQDYIPNEHLDYADALADPIKHQSAKREEQLAGLLEIEHVTRQPKERDVNKETEVITVDQVPFPAQPLLPYAPEEFPDIIKPPAPVQTPRENLVATVMSEFKALSVEELKMMKVYEKFVKKQSKDLKELQKKNLKKLQSENLKKCSVIEKNFKRSIKKNESKEPVQERDVQELLKLGVELFSTEKEMQEDHLKESFKKLKELAVECQAAQMKKVKEMCDKEKKEIQKILDRKRQNSITEAKTKEKEKAETELSEINKKHIQDSVTSIRKLEEEQVKRQESLKLKHQEVLQYIDEENLQQRAELEIKLGEQYQQLVKKICQQFQSELQNKGLPNDELLSSPFNHSSPGSSPPSNCSTPHLQSASHQSSWSKSMDEIIASLIESTSLSTTSIRSEEFPLSKTGDFNRRK